MKALLLNSGLGKRMGELTANNIKSMVEIAPNTTIISRQVNLLKNAGIKDYVVTTGPFAENFKAYLTELFPDLSFTFVENPVYDSTNYIYSIYLARDFLKDDDILLLHGDLVFDSRALTLALNSNHSVMTVDSSLKLPEKDFKAVIKNDKIKAVGIEFFENAVEAQPLYKLNKDDWQIWLNKIEEFCKNSITNVYAENALNEISENINLLPLDLKGIFCGEIDNPDDLDLVKNLYSTLL